MTKDALTGALVKLTEMDNLLCRASDADGRIRIAFELIDILRRVLQEDLRGWERYDKRSGG